MLFLIGLLPALLPIYASGFFPEQLNAFSTSLFEQPPSASYVLNSINNDFPQPLLLDDNLLPQSIHYPLKDLKRLYQASKKCQGPWPVNPIMTEPLVFTRALCFNTQLPSVWFFRSTLIHPGGGSYAARFVEKNPERYDELAKYFHIKERFLAHEDTLLGRLQRMPEDGKNALNNGATYILSNNELWFRKDNEYLVYGESIWLPLMKKNRLLALPVNNSDAFCLSRTGNVCWNQNQAPSYWLQLFFVLAIINILWVAGWVLNRWTINRRSMQERMLVLQILTHELRTPIASLLMTVEGFRRKFDSLPESLYDEFRRLCEDSMRLRQLAEASKDYLQSNQQPLVRQHIPSLSQWLRVICEKSDVEMQLDKDGAVGVNIYWLTISLDNLISNAKKYGKSSVQVSAQIKHKVLIIKVQDQGKLTSKDWKKIRKPFVSEKGLGLGLTIVESMVERMGGTLKLQGPPTTFILEIPCDPSDIVTR